MRSKIIWLSVLPIFFLGVIAHSSTDWRKNSYESTFDKFFVFNGITTENRTIDDNNNPLELMIYYAGRIFGKHPSIDLQTKNYTIFLDNKMEDIKSDALNKKFKLSKIKLKDYNYYILTLANHKNKQEFIASKDIVDKKIRSDLSVMDSIFWDLDLEGKFLIYKIMENEISLLSEKMDGDSLINEFATCDKLNSLMKYSCFKDIAVYISNGSQEETRNAVEAIKNKLDNLILNSWECHFLSHEIGFSLGKKHGIDGASYCLKKYDECTFGCYHGIGEYLFYKTKGDLKGSDFSALNSYDDSLEVFGLHHAIGHSIYRYSKSIREAKLKCRELTSSINRYKRCYSGIGHEFAMDNFFANTSFEDASKACSEFNDTISSCYYQLGLAYSHFGLNKTLYACYSSGSRDCIAGLGFAIDVLYSNGSLSKSKQICNSMVKNRFLGNCYKGIMLSSVNSYNNLTRAFLVCADEKYTSPQCYNDLKLVYNELWFNTSLDFCSFIDDKYKEKCREEILKYEIYKLN